MASSSSEPAGQARAALRVIVSDPGLGFAALSNPRVMANLLKDLLPDAPREKSALVAAAEADLAGVLRGHVAQGMDLSTAAALTVASFAASTPFTPEACRWVVGELAVALGLSSGMAGVAGAAPGPAAGTQPGTGLPADGGQTVTAGPAAPAPGWGPQAAGWAPPAPGWGPQARTPPAPGWGPQPAGWAPPPRTSGKLGGLATALTAGLAVSAAVSLIAVAAPRLAPLASPLFLYLPVTALFLAWFYRARKNADGRGAQQRRAPGWAIGAWFVPVIWLWLPYQIMADIWRAGLPAGRRARPAWPLISWWTCWLLAWFTSFWVTGTWYSSYLYLHGRRAYYGDPPDVLLNLSRLSSLFEAAAAIALIVIVRAVSSGQAGDAATPPIAAS